MRKGAVLLVFYTKFFFLCLSFSLPCRKQQATAIVACFITLGITNFKALKRIHLYSVPFSLIERHISVCHQNSLRGSSLLVQPARGLGQRTFPAPILSRLKDMSRLDSNWRACLQATIKSPETAYKSLAFSSKESKKITICGHRNKGKTMYFQLKLLARLCKCYVGLISVTAYRRTFTLD